ncbi:MAG: hypothetical protein FE78DRAFT_34574 [Acidomyces sp. 'richmondensis']|nr:MAG: hypothetical protein FE78DRAFT_34574 [Acidomyces sp. 'richmondensis']
MSANPSPIDIATCLAFATKRYPHHRFQPLDRQGACSYTFLAEPSTPTEDGEVMILQFRLPRHALPLALAHAAHRVYTPLAPCTTGLGWVGPLQGLAMERLPGDRWGDLQPRGRDLGVWDGTVMERFRRLMEGFAGVFERNWRATVTALRAEKDEEALSMGGKVGASILMRLARLGRELPSRALRVRAKEVEGAVGGAGLDGLPVVLTHGDLLPANILVNGRTWEVTGLVDWAEAEWLPFGIGLYGLEHLLGSLEGEGRRRRFVYYDRAEELRGIFWERLVALVGELNAEGMRKKVLLARDVGILLWRGFAWDDGAIDRVVNWEDDAEEIAYLEAFLGIEASSRRHDSVMDLDFDTDEPTDVICAKMP